MGDFRNSELMKRIVDNRDKGRAKLMGLVSATKPAAKPFLILVVLLLVGYSAVFLANFNYIDDMGRVLSGYKQWDNFSRFTSNFLSSFIHAGNYLPDISPLPQLIAVLEMALAGVIVIWAISERAEFSIWSLAAVVLIAINPYFLECISYKFDAPYMALSVLASVFPVLCMKKDKRVYALLVFACTLVMCTTYQAASGIFPMLVILLTARMWIMGSRGKDAAVFLIVSCVAYVAGLLFFRSFIMIEVANYVDNSLPSLSALGAIAWVHLKEYWFLVISDSRRIWLILAFFIMIAFVYVSVRDAKRNRFVAFSISILLILVMSVLAFGLYPLLSNPITSPRSMYGVGAFIAFLAVTVATSEKAIPSKLIVVALSWTMVVLSFAYGNALCLQEQWMDFRTTITMEDLNNIDAFANDDMKEVQIKGSVGTSPVLWRETEAYPVLRRLLPELYSGEWGWGRIGFMAYYGLKNARYVDASSGTDANDFENLDLPLIKESMYEDIYGDGTKFLIVLK